MATKPEILGAALDTLRRGDALTLDSVARAAGLTKPGVIHHFATKEILAVAVVDHLLDEWDAELLGLLGEVDTPVARLRAYVTFTLMGNIDAADLALMVDARLRDRLASRWAERMVRWFGDSDDPHRAAVRLIADGAWIDRSLGVLDLTADSRSAICDVALALLGEEPEA